MLQSTLVEALKTHLTTLQMECRFHPGWAWRRIQEEMAIQTSQHLTVLRSNWRVHSRHTAQRLTSCTRPGEGHGHATRRSSQKSNLEEALIETIIGANAECASQGMAVRRSDECGQAR